jgi:hypothetical protein
MVRALLDVLNRAIRQKRDDPARFVDKPNVGRAPLIRPSRATFFPREKKGVADVSIFAVSSVVEKARAGG